MWDTERQAYFDEICAEATTEEKIVRTAYDWVTTNMTYGEIHPFYQYFNCRETLSVRTGVCFDYANMFTAICRSWGIRCYCLDGYSRRNASNRHTWNQVYFSGAWWTLDVTNDGIKLGKLFGFQK